MPESNLRVSFEHKPRGEHSDLTTISEKTVSLSLVRRWRDGQIDEQTLLGEEGCTTVLSIRRESGHSYYTNVNGWVAELPED